MPTFLLTIKVDKIKGENQTPAEQLFVLSRLKY